MTAVCNNGNFFANKTNGQFVSGTVYASSNVTTINTTFCSGGSPPQLNNNYGQLVCSNGINTAGGLLGEFPYCCPGLSEYV